jgi:3(or 17)beta-hydroxysteroid dehydrogenase
MSDLIRKAVLITGGASGLGEAMARRFAAGGARVAITDVQTSLGEALAVELGCLFVEQDVTDESQWPPVIRQIQERSGARHVLVNNAGILGTLTYNNPENSKLADWTRTFAVNVEGVFLGCRAAIPAIRTSGGGSIINISSVAALLATPFAMAYGASKAAVRQLTKSVAQYCAENKWGIRCNSVHPGMVRTPAWDKTTADGARMRGVSFDAALEEMSAVVPMGDLTSSQDVAAAVAFLASDDARHITGEQLVIDGGLVHCDTYHTGLAGKRP